eukprot:gene8540-986_t
MFNVGTLAGERCYCSFGKQQDCRQLYLYDDRQIALREYGKLRGTNRASLFIAINIIIVAVESGGANPNTITAITRNKTGNG